MPYRFTRKSNGSIHSSTGRNYKVVSTKSTNNYSRYIVHNITGNKQYKFHRRRGNNMRTLIENKTGYSITSNPKCNETGCTVSTTISGNLPIKHSSKGPKEIADQIAKTVKRLEGPVTSVMLLPKRNLFTLLGRTPPIIWLLGDEHNHRARCESKNDITYSLYADDANRSTLLDYIQEIAKEHVTDIIYETWNSEHKSQDHPSSKKRSSFYDLRGMLSPCINKHHIDTPHTTCNYNGFRIHDGDIRNNRQNHIEVFVTDIISLFIPAVVSVNNGRYLYKNLPTGWLPEDKPIEISYTTLVNFTNRFDNRFDNKYLKSYVQIWQLIFNKTTTIDTLLKNPFFQQNSITYKEFEKLPDAVKTEMLRVLKSYSTIFSSEWDNNLDQLLFTPFLRFLDIGSSQNDRMDVVKILNENASKIKDSLTCRPKKEVFTRLNTVLTDVYTVSRMLKPISLGLTSQLFISYFGFKHTSCQYSLLKQFYEVHTVWGVLPNIHAHVYNNEGTSQYNSIYKTKCISQVAYPEESKGGKRSFRKNKTRRKHRI